jgi:hypothetical protein
MSIKHILPLFLLGIALDTTNTSFAASAQNRPAGNQKTKFT